MKKLLAMLALIGLVLGACGSDDDISSDDEIDDPVITDDPDADDESDEEPLDLDDDDDDAPASDETLPINDGGFFHADGFTEFGDSPFLRGFFAQGSVEIPDGFQAAIGPVCPEDESPTSYGIIHHAVPASWVVDGAGTSGGGSSGDINQSGKHTYVAGDGGIEVSVHLAVTNESEPVPTEAETFTRTAGDFAAFTDAEVTEVGQVTLVDTVLHAFHREGDQTEQYAAAVEVARIPDKSFESQTDRLVLHVGINVGVGSTAPTEDEVLELFGTIRILPCWADSVVERRDLDPAEYPVESS